MRVDRAKEIFTEITKYEIQLASDPKSLGPLYLQNTIAECRNYLNLVSRLMLEVHCERQEASRQLRAAEVSHEVSFTDALANDERVRRLPSIEDRKATVTFILREGVNAINALKSELQDIEFVEKAIRHRHKELTSTMSEIKLQRSLIRDEIDSGAMYGDERQFDHEHSPRSRVSPGLGTDIDEDVIEAMLAEERAKEAAQTPSPVESQPSLETISTSESISDPEKSLSPKSDPSKGSFTTTSDEAKVLEFLGNSAKSVVTEDFDDVFSEI